MVNICVLQSEGDQRLAMSPQVAKKLLSDKKVTLTIIGCTTPEVFSEVKDIKISKDLKDAKNADILISTIVPTQVATLDSLKPGCLIIALNQSISDQGLIDQIKAKNLKFLALNKIPRITRAQSMDVLSSQSNVAGYRAVIEALYEYNKVCPMMMTAAGTIKPSRFLIVGAGVAGLQAIATARRMGAIVSAFDVRKAAKEQVESLGATFVEVEDNEDAETQGGYAKEMSEEYKKKQAKKLEEEVSKANVVITTAQIPNKPAPRLITADMIKKMQPGSVILDMAVETGGNCEGSQPGKVIEKNHVKIIGHKNLPGRVSSDSSMLFAQNILNLLKILLVDGELKLDMEDEIIKSALLVS